jgi:hypothetical protein
VFLQKPVDLRLLPDVVEALLAEPEPPPDGALAA